MEFDSGKIFQPRGTVMDWQCSSCKLLIPLDEIMSQHHHLIESDRIQGLTPKIPHCSECKELLRPNIQLKDDLDFLDERYERESKAFENFLQKNKRSHFTILEIGASCVQPLAREVSRDRWL